MKRIREFSDAVLGWIGVLMITVFLIAGCAEEPKPKPAKAVKAYQITDPGEFAKRSFPGRAAAEQEVNLSFRVSGPLIKLPVKPGDLVKAGDVLARIDPNDFNVQLTGARSALSAAQAGFQRAEADYKRLSKARKEDPGAVSQRAVDLGLATRDQARSAVTAARSNVQTMQDRLNYTYLKAPFNGEIVETYVENYETVIAKQPILRLLNPSRIEMTLAVPENLISYVQYITDISVKFDALPGIKIPATISEVGREASQATHTFSLTITMAQPEGGKLLPGMAGEALIKAKLPEDLRTAMHVPPSSLFAGTDTKNSYVWIIENNTVKRRQVDIGALSGSGVIVNAGLNSGEWIVAAGVYSITEGQKVRIINQRDTQ